MNRRMLLKFAAFSGLLPMQAFRTPALAEAASTAVLALQPNKESAL